MLGLASAHEQSRTGQAALAALSQLYWYPLYTFVRRRGHSPHDAQDLIEGFSCTFWDIGQERAIPATLAWRGHKVEGSGNEWFAVTPETVIEVARMIMAKPT
jgi:hypothetical protein